MLFIRRKMVTVCYWTLLNGMANGWLYYVNETSEIYHPHPHPSLLPPSLIAGNPNPPLLRRCLAQFRHPISSFRLQVNVNSPRFLLNVWTSGVEEVTRIVAKFCKQSSMKYREWCCRICKNEVGSYIADAASDIPNFYRNILIFYDLVNIRWNNLKGFKKIWEML